MNKRKNANANQTMVKLGKIGITPAGEYDAGKTYDKLCLVLGTDGNSYLSTQESVTGVEPGVTEGWEKYWQFLCGSGKGGGVQSDYAQNDETQMDYIKNRPGGYYQTVPAIDIQWDGVVGEKPNVDADEIILVKVSDEILTAEQIIGATVTIVQGSESRSGVILENHITSGDGLVFMSEGFIASFSQTTVEVNGNPLTVPETGTYFVYIEHDGEKVYASGLTKPESQKLVPIPGELTNIKGGYDLPGKTEELYNGTIAADSWIEKETSSQNLESDVAVQASAAPSIYYEASITLAAELIDGATITGTVAGTKVSGTVSGERVELYIVSNPKAVKVFGGGGLIYVITQNSIQASSAPGTDIEVQLTQTVGGGPVIIPAEYLDTAALETSISNAQDAAALAQTEANQARTAADNAQTTAEAAQTTAEAAQTTAESAVRPYKDSTEACSYYMQNPYNNEKPVTLYLGRSGGSSLTISVNKNKTPSVKVYMPIYFNQQADLEFIRTTPYPYPQIVGIRGIVMASSTENSTKKFQITVDDSGTVSATEVTS